MGSGQLLSDPADRTDSPSKSMVPVPATLRPPTKSPGVSLSTIPSEKISPTRATDVIEVEIDGDWRVGHDPEGHPQKPFCGSSGLATVTTVTERSSSPPDVKDHIRRRPGGGDDSPDVAGCAPHALVLQARRHRVRGSLRPANQATPPGSGDGFDRPPTSCRAAIRACSWESLNWSEPACRAASPLVSGVQQRRGPRRPTGRSIR